MSVSSDHAVAVENSSVWAAYGDALGFMTELADSPDRVRARVGTQTVSRLVGWKRQIGGRFGVKAELPAGCYSDDTQLRLATSRAIGADGRFDVEAFSKVELPVWLSYALGGGRGTKAAANALVARKAGWSTNFFEGASGSYVNGGGNGAAMRIQPHVWSAREPTDVSVLTDVVRNAVCTHGHARAIAGAALHAVALGIVLDRGEALSPDRWLELVSKIELLPEIIQADDVLRLAWVPMWERAQRRSLSECFAVVADECRLDIAAMTSQLSGLDHYTDLVRGIGASTMATRGSGTKTSLLALPLAWWATKVEPSEVLAMAANVLDSDTDTIATMAGALIGASYQHRMFDPPEPPLDRKLFHTQAMRLSQIAATGRAKGDFPYPDLLHWTPPRTQTDALGTWDGEVGVAGLGHAGLVGGPLAGVGAKPALWQWATLWFGQTALIKRRPDLPRLAAMSQPRRVQRPKPGRRGSARSDNGTPSAREHGDVHVRAETNVTSRPDEAAQGLLFEGAPQPSSSAGRGTGLSVEDAFGIAQSRDFAVSAVGSLLLQLAEQDSGTDLAVAFAALVAHARRPQVRSRL